MRLEKFLALGNKIASVADLKELRKLLPLKYKHLLKAEDLNVRDKMNYASCERLCHPRVQTLLNEYVPSMRANYCTVSLIRKLIFFLLDSEGTQFYLKLMSYITSSYMDKEIKPLERVYRMWFSVFGMRLWRRWILRDEEYTLAENFLSLNCYLSAEINAHCIVLLILACVERPERFQPWHVGSQPCEGEFRYRNYE